MSDHDGSPAPKPSGEAWGIGLALGTGVGGFPLDEAARITVAAVRDELERSPEIEHVIFALRGAAAYEAFGAAMAPALAPVTQASPSEGAA